MAHFLGIGTSARRYACAAPSSNNAARTWFCESSAEARIKGEAHSLCAPHDARKAACAKPAFVAHLARSVAGIEPSGDGTDGPAGGGSASPTGAPTRARGIPRRTPAPPPPRAAPLDAAVPPRTTAASSSTSPERDRGFPARRPAAATPCPPCSPRRAACTDRRRPRNREAPWTGPRLVSSATRSNPCEQTKHDVSV